MQVTFPDAEYRSANLLADEVEVLSGMLGFVKAPTMRRSRSSCKITPGEVSVTPIRETPESIGFDGNDARSGFSIFRPFWRRTILVCPGVTAGAMISATVGGTSAMFLVVTTMKSKDSRHPLEIFGTDLSTLN